jgi:hypothetical protein
MNSRSCTTSAIWNASSWRPNEQRPRGALPRLVRCGSAAGLLLVVRSSSPRCASPQRPGAPTPDCAIGRELAGHTRARWAVTAAHPVGKPSEPRADGRVPVRATKGRTVVETETYRGVWWTPSSPEEQLAGTLTITDGEPNLDVVGTFGRKLLSETALPEPCRSRLPTRSGSWDWRPMARKSRLSTAPRPTR